MLQKTELFTFKLCQAFVKLCVSGIFLAERTFSTFSWPFRRSKITERTNEAAEQPAASEKKKRKKQEQRLTGQQGSYSQK